MPKTAREISRTGVYHVMLRGINRQEIFEEKEDYLFFLNLIKKAKEKCSFELLAYCLMDNHVHLLMKEADNSISEIIRIIAGRYGSWYNKKYDRVGHVFQSRFRSECVITPGSMLRVARYIHRNPLKAGICRKPEDYEYSSYNEYLHSPKIISKEMIIQYMTLQEFVKYNNIPNSDTFLEIEEVSVPKQTEEQAKELIKSKTGCDTIAGFQALPKHLRQEYLQQLRAEGISIRQLSRLTGESRGVIQRLCR
jgi:REP element-mobilizing transposase RayT